MAQTMFFSDEPVKKPGSKNNKKLNPFKGMGYNHPKLFADEMAKGTSYEQVAFMARALAVATEESPKNGGFWSSVFGYARKKAK